MRMSIEENVIHVINSIMGTGLSNENIQDNLQQIGMDSIKFIQIIVALEGKFGIEVPDEKLLINAMSTLKQIIGVVSNEMQNVDGVKFL